MNISSILVRRSLAGGPSLLLFQFAHCPALLSYSARSIDTGSIRTACITGRSAAKNAPTRIASDGHVHATDGDIGQLHGLRVEPASGQVTHVLVREGHLLTRKDVAVPRSSVAGFDDGIRLTITRQQVRDLPPADAGPSAS